MPPPFQDLDPNADPPDLVRLLDRFPFERKITAVHLHHTWRPRQSEWRGHQTLQTMWYTHTRQLGWSDIAQHLTIAPDGWLWTGRDWNRPPCSASGANGTRQEGPFMVTVAGDFNEGADSCSDMQYEQLVDAIARIQLRFGLDADTIRFHCDLDPRPVIRCPGKSMVRDKLVQAIAAYRPIPLETPQPGAKVSKQPFGEDAEVWYQFITSCNNNRRRFRDEPPDVPRDLGDLLLDADATPARKLA
jgi:N-acetylmuramoyl-L-alanine amidase